MLAGGNSNVETAIDLADVVKPVSMLGFPSGMKVDPVQVKKLHSLPNVTPHIDTQTTEINGEGGNVSGLAFKHRGDCTDVRIDLEGMFVQISLVPNTE